MTTGGEGWMGPKLLGKRIQECCPPGQHSAGQKGGVTQDENLVSSRGSATNERHDTSFSSSSSSSSSSFSSPPYYSCSYFLVSLFFSHLIPRRDLLEIQLKRSKVGMQSGMSLFFPFLSFSSSSFFLLDWDK